MFEGMRAAREAKRAAEAGDQVELVRMLTDPEPGVRKSAASACWHLEPPSPQPILAGALLRAAKDPDAGVRAQATLVLGELRVREGADIFLRSLEDESWEVRMYGATVLGWMPDPRAVEPLRRLLRDAEPLVRQFAVSALGKIGDPQAIRDIEEMLRSERDRDARQWAEEALEQLLQATPPDR